MNLLNKALHWGKMGPGEALVVGLLLGVQLGATLMLLFIGVMVALGRLAG